MGHFDEPQCVQVCPVECIPINPAHVETRDELTTKYRRLLGLDVAASETPASGPPPTRGGTPAA